MAYPHHLHYQEQFQLFLFDSNYVWDIVKQPGGVADLLGRFCMQFFLYAWVGAIIIGILLLAIQLLVSRFVGGGWFYGLSYVPSFLLWLFLLDEHALMGGVWAVLLTLLAVWGLSKLPKGWGRYIAVIVVLPILYWMVGSYWSGSHYYRYPRVFPTLLYVAWLLALAIPLLAYVCRKWLKDSKGLVIPLCSFALVAVVMGAVVWKNANFKAEKVMQYDFMASHQQWNRIIETANKEKPNNQIGVTVQNLALAMRGVLLDQMQNYNQNGIAGLLPDVQSDATSPMPTAEAFYQLGMINVAQRTVFEAQEAILDFQKSGRCYKRLAQTSLIIGSYEVARKYLMALQKTLFYREWANETLPLLGDEEAIAKHPEYGRLRKWAYKDNFFFSDHVTPEMLESLYSGCTDNSMAYQYLMAYYMLTGDRERYNNFISKNR
ncbi:MAG: hypothetical protein E7102_03065 [Prevotella ruminicola]|jgi:hypothetical protein|uniref:Transmembrane protein n=1 Tax=Xylanibacter ruminicola TaxID=839 RepID=A0A928GI00_XYLRU|nr:hypothetical protein [Xylanibacter ruminicola]